MMMSIQRIGSIIPAFGLVCALSAAPALAQTSMAPPSMAPTSTTSNSMTPAKPAAGGMMAAPGTAAAPREAQGAPPGRGPSHRFATIAAATAHCPSDTIVWSSRSGKSYHLAASKYYGKTKHGFYACKAEADDAGFHALSN